MTDENRPPEGGEPREPPAIESRPAPPDLGPLLEPLPYHRETIEYLRSAEAELWNWFSSTAFLHEYARTVRLDLLKSCYRFERADHAQLYALADEAREKLGLTAPVTLYQSQSATAMNAFLSYVPGEAHVVLEGPVRSTLTPEEVRAALAHELTHYLLWESHGGELLVADQMLSAMASHDRTQPSHIESARLYRLYLEVHADRGALAVGDGPLAAISSLIKIQTGLADAQAESYLRQSEEIFGQTEVKTEELTHPESFIRARALMLWAERGPAANDEVARMIEGPLDLDRLSLVGQGRLSRTTRRVLVRFLDAPWLRTDALLAHARLFFPDIEPANEKEQEGAGSLRDDLHGVGDSVREYLCYVLLDLATVDRQLDEAPLAAALRLAEDLGLDGRFLEAAAQELELSKRVVTRLKRDAAQILADAARTADRPEA